MIMSGYDLGKIKYAPPSNKRPPSYPKFEISAPGANSKIIVSISNENKTYWMHCLTVQIGFLQRKLTLNQSVIDTIKILIDTQYTSNWYSVDTWLTLDQHSINIYTDIWSTLGL